MTRDEFSEFARASRQFLVAFAAKNGFGVEAEDIAQQALLLAWEHLDTFRDECSLRTWVTRIALNVCLTINRTEWRRGEMPKDHEPSIAADESFRFQLVAFNGVQRLPPKLRDVMVLHLAGASPKQIADRLGISDAAMKSRLHCARRKLRAKLEAA